MAALSDAVARALRARGVAQLTASLVAEAGVAVFKVGFERWLDAKKPGHFATHIRAAADALRQRRVTQRRRSGAAVLGQVEREAELPSLSARARGRC